MPAEPGEKATWTWHRVRFAGIMRDGLRALWAMFHWNVRKTWYVWRGRRGGAPCQHQHDVQDGRQPRCEAVWNWDAPGRFHRVCPLLTRTSQGWRCSAAPAQVRPFWGRAVGVYASLALAFYLGVTGGLLLVWRSVGYREIAYIDVAWPGRWSRVKPAQADYFRKQGRLALERDDPAAALLSLVTAEKFQGGTYADQLLLARLWAQAGNVDFAGRYFRGVMAAYPERAAEAAAAWHDQLLASGHLAALAELCVQRVSSAGESAGESLWEFSLLFAMDHGRLAEAMERGKVGERARLPGRLRALMEVLAQWQRGESQPAALTLKAIRFTSAEPLAIRCQIEWLAQLGHPHEAGLILNRHAGAFGPFETAALRYYVDVVSEDRDAARASFISMLQAPLTPAQADRLCSLAIRSGDEESLRRSPGFFALEPLNRNAQSQAAFWVAALVCKAPSLVAGARGRYEAASDGDALPVVGKVDFEKQSPADRESPLFIAAFVPLPRETIYALIARGADAAR